MHAFWLLLAYLSETGLLKRHFTQIITTIHIQWAHAVWTANLQLKLSFVVPITEAKTLIDIYSSSYATDVMMTVWTISVHFSYVCQNDFNSNNNDSSMMMRYFMRCFSWFTY